MPFDHDDNAARDRKSSLYKHFDINIFVRLWVYSEWLIAADSAFRILRKICILSWLYSGEIT